MTERQPYLTIGPLDKNVSGPVILAFHGIGASEKDLVPAFDSFHSIATLVHPRGPLQSNFGYAWYQLRQIGVPDPQSFAAALETVDQWVNFMQHEYGKKPDDIYLTGFSQGTILSLSYALQNPHKVRGVLGFSGYIPKSVLEATQGQAIGRPLAIFLTHGQRDEMFPIHIMDETATQLRERGHVFQTFTQEGGHEILRPAIVAAKAWLEKQL